MAIRTTAAEVKQIMDSCDVSDTIVDVYITAASALVDETLSSDTTLTTTLLEEIERWLTAHMIASTIWRTTKKEKIGDVSVEYTGQFKENLSSTPYGQMVLMLDISGKMGNLGKAAASIYAVETDNDDNT